MFGSGSDWADGTPACGPGASWGWAGAVADKDVSAGFGGFRGLAGNRDAGLPQAGEPGFDDADQWLADCDDRPRFGMQRGYQAVEGGRHFDRGLSRLHLGDDLVDGHLVANLDPPRDA